MLTNIKAANKYLRILICSLLLFRVTFTLSVLHARGDSHLKCVLNFNFV